MSQNYPQIRSDSLGYLWKEQRVVIKLLTASGKHPAECHRELQAVFSQDAMSKARVRVWHSLIKGRGDVSVNNKGRSGQPV